MHLNTQLGTALLIDQIQNYILREFLELFNVLCFIYDAVRSPYKLFEFDCKLNYTVFRLRRLFIWFLYDFQEIIYDLCMTNKKSYKSCIAQYEVKECCMIPDPGVRLNYLIQKNSFCAWNIMRLEKLFFF